MYRRKIVLQCVNDRFDVFVEGVFFGRVFHYSENHWYGGTKDGFPFGLAGTLSFTCKDSVAKYLVNRCEDAK